MTRAEARRGETLDQRLAQEEPDVSGARESSGPGARSGRLVSADEGAHAISSAEPRQFARDAGVDGGAASAEEAAVHVLPDEEIGPQEDEYDDNAIADRRGRESG